MEEGWSEQGDVTGVGVRSKVWFRVSNFKLVLILMKGVFC